MEGKEDRKRRELFINNLRERHGRASDGRVSNGGSPILSLQLWGDVSDHTYFPGVMIGPPRQTHSSFTERYSDRSIFFL